MILGFSGHRCVDNYQFVYNQLCNWLLNNKPEKCITGMACGFDMMGAKACIELGIPFVAAIPFANQEAFFPPKDVILYNILLKSAHEIHFVDSGIFANYKYQKRNEWICNNCDELLYYLKENKGNIMKAMYHYDFVFQIFLKI